MDKHGRWSLAPAYDMVCSIYPSTLGIQKGRFMSIKGKVPGITEKDILAIARENDMTCDIMRKELNDKYTSFE